MHVNPRRAELVGEILQHQFAHVIEVFGHQPGGAFNIALYEHVEHLAVLIYRYLHPLGDIILNLLEIAICVHNPPTIVLMRLLPTVETSQL